MVLVSNLEKRFVEVRELLGGHCMCCCALFAAVLVGVTDVGRAICLVEPARVTLLALTTKTKECANESCVKGLRITYVSDRPQVMAVL